MRSSYVWGPVLGSLSPVASLQLPCGASAISKIVAQWIWLADEARMTAHAAGVRQNVRC